MCQARARSLLTPQETAIKVKESDHQGTGATTYKGSAQAGGEAASVKSAQGLHFEYLAESGKFKKKQSPCSTVHGKPISSALITRETDKLRE